jgi:sialic acid synthase SpsE/quercetin dioxygenase-like cupin family protein
MTLKDLSPLFVFEMANNHMGSLEHGVRIIREFTQCTKGFDFRFGFKLQYRQLDTFIHPDFKSRNDIKYVKRFSETRLNADELLTLKNEMQAAGFVTVCTPFDEPSMDLIEEHGFDIIKIASCSFTDWPLLECIVKTDKPIIASTACASLEDLDRVVSFLDHRGKDFALMHCTGEYPTPDGRLQLNQIDLLRTRYPQVLIGHSTHENPDNIDSIKLAVAKGASIFEKHVGVPTETMPLNNYSATPDQVRHWLESAREAFRLCGVSGRRPEFGSGEIATLHSLQRGVFAGRSIANGERIRQADLFLAIPTIDGQITGNDLSKYTEFYAEADIPMNSPLLVSNTRRKDVRESVYNIVQRVKQFLRASGVAFPPRVDLEISHHYGIDRFEEFGLTMMTVVNREYCKKLIVLLPGQKHPEQYHKQKEETFHILYGDTWVSLDGRMQTHKAGEVVLVERGTRHIFGTEHGAIIEEISSTHHANDSFYTDPAINQNQDRKTLLTYWLD